MGSLHACTKFFQSAELKLFHGSFAPAEFLCNLPNALLLYEPQHHNPPLILGKPLYQLEERCALLNLFHAEVLRIIGNGISTLPRRAPPPIDDAVRRDANEPRGKRSPTPLERFQVLERMMKDVGRTVFCLFASTHAARNVGVHLIDVALIQLPKARRIALGRLDQKALVRFVLQGLQPALRMSRSVR